MNETGCTAFQSVKSAVKEHHPATTHKTLTRSLTLSHPDPAASPTLPLPPAGSRAHAPTLLGVG